MTPPLTRFETVMGTVVTIDVYPSHDLSGEQSAHLRQRIEHACAILHRVDEVFSTWRPDSPVSRLRRGEIALADAPAEVAAVVAACAQARDLSAGWFDPWALPGGFDPAGYVKGWAAERALAAIGPADGIAGAMVNAAGDIASCGLLATGQPFRIGIADPAAPMRLAGIVELTGAIATSGSYERGLHLIDPRSGSPVMRTASASVTGPELGLADALATALAVAGPDGLAFVESVPGFAGLVIGCDGAMRSSPAFPWAR